MAIFGAHHKIGTILLGLGSKDRTLACACHGSCAVICVAKAVSGSAFLGAEPDEGQREQSRFRKRLHDEHCSGCRLQPGILTMGMNGGLISLLIIPPGGHFEVLLVNRNQVSVSGWTVQMGEQVVAPGL